ncbi:MAG: sigma-54-dependent transcriptional regulator [Thermoanaerobaculia bacterium]
MARRTRILVVDDEEAMREVLRERLRAWGFAVRATDDCESALTGLEAFDPQLIISDVMLPDGSGVDLLDKLRELRPDLPVVLITAHGSVDLAVEAMKQGAHDFLTKPIDYDHLRSILQAALQQEQERRRTEETVTKIGEDARLGALIGSSEAMTRVYDLIKEVADSEASVLITGESGTGKELVGRELHDRSRRSAGPFIAVNAAAIPRDLMESEIFGHERGAFTGATSMRHGCFELAHEGTLLLDEIAEMPLPLQPKLLRVLEDGRVRRLGGTREFEFDVRVLAATNRDANEARRGGQLREDLYYRLAVFEIQLPPLRERPEDLPLLCQHFIDRLNAKHGTEVEGIRDGALERLQRYPWPGNVRELRNLIERAVVLAKEGWIDTAHLPPYLEAGAVRRDVIELRVGTTVAEAEKELILRTLAETDNNKAEAARRLGIDVKTVRNKLKSWGIDLPGN